MQTVKPLKDTVYWNHSIENFISNLNSYLENNEILEMDLSIIEPLLQPLRILFYTKFVFRSNTFIVYIFLVTSINEKQIVCNRIPLYKRTLRNRLDVSLNTIQNKRNNEISINK